MSDSCNPMDCGLPGSSVHGILQARILEWVAIFFTRESSQPRNWTQKLNPGLPHCRQTLYRLSHQGSPPLIVTSCSEETVSQPGIDSVLYLLQTWSGYRMFSIMTRFLMSSFCNRIYSLPLLSSISLVSISIIWSLQESHTNEPYSM